LICDGGAVIRQLVGQNVLSDAILIHSMMIFSIRAGRGLPPIYMMNLGVKRGMVVYGQDRLDEISLSAPTTVCEFKDGWMKNYVIKPEDFGMERCTKADPLPHHAPRKGFCAL